MTPQPHTIETQAIAVRERNDVVSADDFMPLMTVQQAVTRKEMVNQFVGRVLKEDEDYGKMPGGQMKKVLLKPGAEKLCSIFGLAPQYTEDKIIEDWTGAEHGGEPLFYYSYRCALSRGGRFMGEAIGSCNSWESKYRYRWVSEDVAKQRTNHEDLPRRGGTRTLFEPTFAIDKSETGGKYGKPAEYWERWHAAIQDGSARSASKKLGTREFQGYEMTVNETQYRVPNPDIADIINTCQKMAQKRALVAAVLVVTNCSDAFTQDVEDFDQQDHQQHQPQEQLGAGKPGAAPAATQAEAAEPEEPRTPTTKRILPVELRELVNKIRATPNQTTVQGAFRVLEDNLVEKFGTVQGLAEYKRVVEAFDSTVPPKNRKVGDIVECLMDLWESLQKPVEASA